MTKVRGLLARGAIHGIKAMAAVALAMAVHVSPGATQGFGSSAVANVGPAEAALFPDLAALQDRLEQQGWLLHGQATFVLQGNAGFRSPYRGEGSLSPAANARNTLSTDLVLGRRLWTGAEVILDASVTRGFGLSNSTGVAAFPNNEAFRLGSSEPTFFVPRAFFRQTSHVIPDLPPVVGQKPEHETDCSGDQQSWQRVLAENRPSSAPCLTGPNNRVAVNSCVSPIRRDEASGATLMNGV